MIIDTTRIAAMDKLQRVQFATTLPGPKPVCLVGTRSATGLANLAPFSSITHLGSIPILLGMVTRPDTVDRHTLANILATGSWTLNHVTSATVHLAHQCSARYPAGVSEFDATGLTEVNHPGIAAPFVAECPIRMALELEEIIPIASNGTQLIVGRVLLVEIPDDAFSPDGSVDIAGHGSMASTALDTYFSISPHSRIGHAKAPLGDLERSATDTVGRGNVSPPGGGRGPLEIG